MRKYTRIYEAFYKKVKISMIAYVLSICFAEYNKLIFLLNKIKMSLFSSKDIRNRIVLTNELNRVSAKPKMEYGWNDKDDTDIMLSIIIPAYNAEKYIKASVEPLCTIATKYKIEVIVVNDGSKDRTEIVMNELRNRFDNIVYVSVENGGAAKARNIGMDIATGKYLMFVDSDDIVKIENVENVLNELIDADADIIQASYESFNEKGVFASKVFNDHIVTDKQKIMKASGFPWGKIYKRDLFKGVRFPSNVEYEDTIIHMIIYQKCKKMIFTSKIIYNYRDNIEGLTHSLGKTLKTVDSYWVVEGIIESYSRLNIEVDLELYCFLVRHLGINTVSRTKHLPKEIQEIVFELSANLIGEHYKKFKGEKIPSIYRAIEKSYLKGDFNALMRCYNYAIWILNM